MPVLRAVEPELRALAIRTEARQLSEDLAAFIPEAWKIVEPGRAFLGNWHIDAITEHLEAVSAGQIKRLLINVPFRTMKSTLVSVIWPAWVWTRSPSHQWLCTSYAEKLALRDNLKMRRLVQSRWYRERWGNVFSLAGDQNAKQRFENDKAGHRIGAGMSSVMGDGGDTIIVDDPHDREGSDSELQRETTLTNFDEALVPRLNDPASSAIVVIMQRLNMGDLSGHVLKQPGWDHLCIPMEYEPAHPFPSRTRLGWRDPRSKPGELMWPKRFPRETVESLKASLGAAASGQLQQRPSPEGGAILVRDWWRVWTQERLPRIEKVLLSFDTAHKERQENDYSAMTAWGLFLPDDRKEDEEYHAILLRAWQKRLKFPALVDLAKSEANDDEDRYGGPPEFCVIEDKAAGISLLQTFEDAGIPAFPYNPGRESKVARANIQSLMLRSGRIWCMGRRQTDGTRSATQLTPTAEMVVSQCELFPNDEHDDLVDTCVQAWAFLADGGWLVTDTALPEVEPEYYDEPRAPVYG